MTTTARPSAGHCIRCGRPYETATHPDCECAGEPPRRDAGVPLSEWNKHRARVRALRYLPRSSKAV